MRQRCQRRLSTSLSPSCPDCVSSTGWLKEKRGVFYRRGKASFHIHEHISGLDVDVCLGTDSKRFPVQTSEEQSVRGKGWPGTRTGDCGRQPAAHVALGGASDRLVPSAEPSIGSGLIARPRRCSAYVFGRPDRHIEDAVPARWRPGLWDGSAAPRHRRLRRDRGPVSVPRFWPLIGEVRTVG